CRPDFGDASTADSASRDASGPRIISDAAPLGIENVLVVSDGSAITESAITFALISCVALDEVRYSLRLIDFPSVERLPTSRAVLRVSVAPTPGRRSATSH